MNYIAAALLLCLNPSNDKEIINGINLNKENFCIMDKSYEEKFFLIFTYIM